jgi:hypothetical protein
MNTDRQKIVFFLLGVSFLFLVCAAGIVGFAGGFLAERFPFPAPSPTVEVLAVEIFADQDWQSTGIRVNAGDLLVITQVGGTWSECPDYGCPFRDGNGNLESDPYGGNNILSDCYHAALIGRLSEYNLFCIGTAYSGTASETGILELRINDNVIEDNAGALSVRVERR